MKHKTAIQLAMALFVAASSAHAVPACNPDDLKAIAFAGDLTPRQPYTHYVVTYPFGSRKFYGFNAVFAIDATGHVTCASIDSDINPDFDAPPEMTPQRQTWLDHLAETVFDPYVEDGHATPAYTRTFTLPEEQLPRYHVRPPSGDATSAHIHQADTSRSIPGPDPYRLDIYGDGRVVYADTAAPEIGRLTYRIDPAEVRALLDAAAAIDFWSLDDEAMRSFMGASNSGTTITYAGRQNSVGYVAGPDGGLPDRFYEFQEKVARAAHLDWWETLPAEALAQMQAHGFDFKGPAGAALLSSAMRRRMPEDSIERLLALDPPVSWSPPGLGGLSDSPLVAALQTGHVDLAEAMIAGSALLRNGQPDPVRVNSAFVGAVSGATLDGLELIAPLRPRLLEPDPAGDALNGIPSNDFILPPSVKYRVAAAKSRVSVLFWLPGYREKPGQAAVAEWLLAHGASPNARNAKKQSILSYAAARGQTDIAKILLAHGASPNAIDKDDTPPLPESWDEDLTLLLLDAGADPRKLDAFDYPPLEFYRKINKKDWSRVRAWLEAHGYGDWLAAQADRLAKAAKAARP